MRSSVESEIFTNDPVRFHTPKSDAFPLTFSFDLSSTDRPKIYACIAFINPNTVIGINDTTKVAAAPKKDNDSHTAANTAGVIDNTPNAITADCAAKSIPT